MCLFVSKYFKTNINGQISKFDLCPTFADEKSVNKSAILLLFPSFGSKIIIQN